MSLTVLVCGSRGWTDRGRIRADLDDLWCLHEPGLTVIEGGAKGADRYAGVWAAEKRALGCGWVRFTADWITHGKAAGIVRNREMLAWLLKCRTMGQDILVMAYQLGDTSGTRNMIELAKAAHVPGRVVRARTRGNGTPLT